MGTVAEDTPELLFERIQELQDRLDQSPQDGTRRLADELSSAIVQMYGSGLERIFAGLADGGEAGSEIAARLAEDPLIATLLLIHDLHPIALEQRVADALESVRPYMESHGGNVELLGVTAGVARIRLQGSCSDCSASSATLELAIKQALEEAAPDLAGLEVEGVAPQTVPGTGLPMATGTAGATLPMAGGAGEELPIVMSGPAPQPSWVELELVAEPGDGTLAAVQVAGQALVLANVEGSLLAYRDRCAACGGPLHQGELSAGALACPSCQRTFFLPRAGRSLDDDGLQLDPIPLLREQGQVRVALATSHAP